jgi:hypothetical protein
MPEIHHGNSHTNAQRRLDGPSRAEFAENRGQVQHRDRPNPHKDVRGGYSPEETEDVV